GDDQPLDRRGNRRFGQRSFPEQSGKARVLDQSERLVDDRAAPLRIAHAGLPLEPPVGGGATLSGRYRWQPLEQGMQGNAARGGFALLRRGRRIGQFVLDRGRWRE